jgi:hypothetical protein
MTARSPLRLRLVLASFGVIIGGGATASAAVAGNIPFTVLFAVIAALACVNVAIVIIRIRQGARYQPGPDTPPLAQERQARPRGPFTR